jgi:glutaredoxin
LIKGKNILVYGRSTPRCGYCENLKELFKEKEVEYTYKDISDEEVYMDFCKHRLKTVPAVFIDGEFFGGFTEVSKVL